MKLRRCWWRND